MIAYIELKSIIMCERIVKKGEQKRKLKIADVEFNGGGGGGRRESI